MLDALFQQFIDKSPTPVMLGGTLERLFSPEKLDADFNGALNIATVGAAVTRSEYSFLSCPLPQWAAKAAG